VFKINLKMSMYYHSVVTMYISSGNKCEGKDGRYAYETSY
jgi:hypothetical protein